jgi:hypothetical protein
VARDLRIIFASLAIFVLMPAFARATNSPELVENGAQVSTGTLFQATNSGRLIATDGSGNTIWMCETVTATGSVTRNDGSNFESNITAVAISNNGSQCSGSLGSTTVTTAVAINGVPWCLRSTSAMGTDEFQIRGNSCGNLARPIRLIFDMSLGSPCTYQRTAAISGAFTTGIGTTVLSLSSVEVVLLEGGIGCPAATYLDLSLSLETDGTSTRLDLA